VAALPEEIRTERLSLRRWSLDAIDDLREAIMASFDELHRWMAWAATMPTDDVLRAVIDEAIVDFDEDAEWRYFAFERDSGALVGGTGLHRRGGPEELEVGYWMRTDRTGRGYASEASRALTTAAFESPLGIERVKITMDPANAASQAVPRKLGFALEAEYQREPVTPGHTGTAISWVMDRSRWTL